MKQSKSFQWNTKKYCTRSRAEGKFASFITSEIPVLINCQIAPEKDILQNEQILNISIASDDEHV